MPAPQLDLNVHTDEHPDFVAYARDLANALRDTIFIDQVCIPRRVQFDPDPIHTNCRQVNYNIESRRTAMQLLEEHINENIVKVNPKKL